jgi:hypothetical protein
MTAVKKVAVNFPDNRQPNFFRGLLHEIHQNLLCNYWLGFVVLVNGDAGRGPDDLHLDGKRRKQPLGGLRELEPHLAGLPAQ